MRVFRPLKATRRRALLAAAVVGLLVLVPAALAGATTIARLTGRVTPGITAFTTTPQSVRLTVNADFSGQGSEIGSLTRAIVEFSHGARVQGQYFPSCDPVRLQRAHGRPSACPKGSRLGSGTAEGQSAHIREKLAVTVYNGPHGRSLLFWLAGSQPADVTGLINAPLVAIHSREYGYRLTMNVPPSLQQLLPGEPTQVTHFDATVGGTTTTRAHGKTTRHGYIEVLTCPPGALVPAHGDFFFSDQPQATSNSYLSCG